MSGIWRAALPPPSAGEGTLRSRGGEGYDGAGRRSASMLLPFLKRRPLSRPLLTQGPPSPAEGGGRARVACALLASLLLTLCATLTAAAAEQPARPRLCPEDAPEGVRLPPRPGCGQAAPQARGSDGFRDLGNGVKVRIGGRVGADYDMRR